MTDPALRALPHLGVLAIDGVDAATFLQGQATCDCRLLTPVRGALGALCNLQGRMIVSFYVIATSDGLRLLLPRDRVAHILNHLKKYAVFAKVTLRDDSDALVISGSDCDERNLEPFTVTHANDCTLLHLRGGRVLAIQPAAAGAREDSSRAWRAACISAGELLVDTANADKFLPQALNYDVIDGVNFKKGCYTGQEIVARMHFKGVMKERLYTLRADAETSAQPGTPIVDANSQKVGEVVDAVNVAGVCVVAAVIRHDAVQAGNLRLGGTNELLTPAALPYPLPATR